MKGKTANVKRATLLLFFIPAFLGAQAVHDSSGYIFHRHELCLNLAPALVTAMGASAAEGRFSFFYKYVSKGNKAWRLGTSMTYYDHSHYSPAGADDFTVMSQTDTTEVRRYAQFTRGKRWQVHAGIERRVMTRNDRISFLLGVDVIGGYFSEERKETDRFYVLSPGTGQTYAGTGTFHWQEDVHHSPSTALYSFTPFCFAGASPFAGARYSFGSRWSLLAQISIDMYAAFGKNVTWDYYNGTHTERAYMMGEFDSPGVLSDVSLVYRF